MFSLQIKMKINSIQLGDDHERTKESSECLKHLTQQAVKYQKTLNDIYKGEKNVAIPPLQVAAAFVTRKNSLV